MPLRFYYFSTLMINSAVNLQWFLMGRAIERHTQLDNRFIPVPELTSVPDWAEPVSASPTNVPPLC